MDSVNTFDWSDELSHMIETREVPVFSTAQSDDTYLAVEAFHAYEEGYLAEVPWALEAYLAHEQLTEDR